MGLTIHYEARVATGDRAHAKSLVQAMHRRAREFLRTRKVDQVLSPTSDPVELSKFACLWLMRPDPDDPDTVRGIEVPPLEGRLFPVVVGEDCEPLWLGLCRYPATVQHQGRAIATRLDRGWRFRSACKTQYASLRGWEHFHRCHTTIIALVRAWTELGVTVRILDEGEWWPRRSDATLRRKLDEMNGIVAGMAGALKDASDEGGPSVASPIFEHPHFEHLEAEGLTRHGAAIGEAAKITSAESRGDRPRKEPGK